MTKLLIDGHIYNDNEWTCMNVKDGELSIELQRPVDSPLSGIMGRMPWRFSSDLVKAPALQREVLAALRLDDIFNPRTVMFRAARDAIVGVFREVFGEVFDFPNHSTHVHKDAASFVTRIRRKPLSDEGVVMQQWHEVVFNWDMHESKQAWMLADGAAVVATGEMPRINHQGIGTTPELSDTPPTRETVRDAIIVAVRDVEAIIRLIDARKTQQAEQRGSASIKPVFNSPIPGEVVDITPDQ